MRTCTLLPLVGALFSVYAGAQQLVAEVEPNDGPAQAQPIVAGQQLQCTFAATTDEDWFSFTLAAPGQVHLRSLNSGTLSLSLTRDTRIALYDAAGAVRLAWNDGASGSRADCGVTLPAGSYAFCVGNKSTFTGAVPYDLDFFVLPPHTVDTLEAAEPNDPMQPGGVPTPMTIGDTIEGELSSPADVDFWAFSIPMSGVLQAASHDDGGVPQCDNLALRWYQEIGPNSWAPLGTSNATNSASHRVTSLQHPGILPPGNYAVAVMAGTNAAGTAPWDYVRQGRYSLRTTFSAMPGANQVLEAPEPNDTPVTATFLSLGDDGVGVAQSGNEPDWYAFAAGGPTIITAMAAGAGATPLAGSTLRLLDANGTILASASGGATTHGRLIATVTAPGFYYLQIAASQFAMTGEYVLHTGQGPALYSQSATRVEPASVNACVGSNGLRPLLGFLPGETAVFDSTFVTRVERAVGPTLGVIAMGLSNTTASGGSVALPLPVDVGGLDSQGLQTICTLRVDPIVILLFATDAAGAGELAWTFPWAPAASGIKVYEQAFLVDLALNNRGLSASNDASFVVGDLPF
ncbi:MAG: PPC domain-containing protein [Planctomycetes bacterium]|nr:PPC domain-containing protein [Planctomycetota bacterium]